MKLFSKYLSEASNTRINFKRIIRKFLNDAREVMSPKIKNYNINDIKQFLISESKSTDWTHFVDRCSFGQCDKIALLIESRFDDVTVYEQDNIKVTNPNALSNDEDMNVFNHYFVRVGDRYYDFGKGSLVDNGQYLLDPYGKLYEVDLNKYEQSVYLKNPKIRKIWI